MKMDSFLLLLLSSVVFLQISTVFSLHCYLCSWSPKSKNVTDYCTTKNFHPEIYTIECKTGCEAVAFYDKNNEIELFLRNCVRSGSPVTNDCRKEEFQAFRRDVCTCDSNLCNTAAGVAMSSVVPIRLVIISSLWCLPWFKYWLL